MVQQKVKTKTESANRPAISEVSVSDFKSVHEEVRIAIAPLVVLAGANSSGKSSLMQGLLLLKQTLEAPYDPGALLLDGPNVRFSSVDQILHHHNRTTASQFSIGISLSHKVGFRLAFRRGTTSPLEIQECDLTNKNVEIALRPDMTSDDVAKMIGNQVVGFDPTKLNYVIKRERCFLTADSDVLMDSVSELPAFSHLYTHLQVFGTYSFAKALRCIVHLPGLRGNPERSYRLSATSDEFPGDFTSYVASLVDLWSQKKDSRLDQLGSDLQHLGLTWKVAAKKLDDTRIELRVGRLPRPAQGGARDLVNIADVGLGVSQTLPVLVALLAAQRNDLVYIEQPEIHLHPRAQLAMAELLVRAAKRGVRVVIETHSSILLLGIQKCVAEGTIANDKVRLHWFDRDAQTGATKVTPAELDEAGRFGTWPADFDDVSLQSMSAFLDASEKRQAAP